MSATQSKSLRCATWNVNSLRVRLPQVIEWLNDKQPDLLALQETKIIDKDFPVADFKAVSYQVNFSGQKTYNGVAILSRLPDPPANIVTDLPGFEDPQRRVLAITYGDMRLINLYVPNGSEVGSEKFRYKLDWLSALHDYLNEQLNQFSKLIVVGDFNIAPEDRDIYDPELWQGAVLSSPPEREAFQRLLELGLTDAFRLFDQPDQTFSWWDYRAAAFRRNLGLRIDHILISKALRKACQACSIDKTPRGWERPSDHAPVVADFKLSTDI
jgi:exodeoxyribonuclease-3